MRNASTTTCLALLSAVLGCANDATEDSEVVPLSEGPQLADPHANFDCHGRPHQRIRAATFNAALAPGFAAFAVERAPRVIAALTEESHDLDVLCVQEFWLQPHFDALAASVTQLPHAMRMAPRPGSGNCSDSEFLPLAACLGAHCGTASSDTLADCATSNCPVEVASLSGGCLGCILNHMDGIEACLGDGQVPSDPAIFGGSFDVGLLSRWPIVRSDTKELTSYFVRASVLYAQIAVPRFGTLDVFCTHLGSPLGIVPYAGTNGGWEQEHAMQISELLAFIRDEHQDQRPLVVIGDLNCGPALPGIDGAWQPNYQMLLDAGLDDAYATDHQPLCTNCAGTSFRDTGATNEIIDHILSMRLPVRHTKSERLFVDAIELVPSLPAFNLSDHFGLKTVFDSEHRRFGHR